MDDRDHNPFVDELLDATLARYRSAEPRLGLEERILTRVRSEQLPKPWLGWTWRLAAGVATFALVLATAHWARRTMFAPGASARNLVSRPTEPSQSATSASTSRPEATRREASHALRESSSQAVRHAAFRQAVAEPRQDIFPSPAPLSEQEELLVRYVRQNPAPVLIALRAGEQPIEDLQIKDLEVPPLEAEDAESKKNQ